MSNAPIPLSKKDQVAAEELRRNVSQSLGKALIHLVLFGSKVTGKDTPESDIAILVLIDDTALCWKERILDIAFEVKGFIEECGKVLENSLATPRED